MNTKKVESGVYYIKCLSNGKHYVGSTFSLKGRKMSHFSEESKNKMSSNHANFSGENNPTNKLSRKNCEQILKLLAEKTSEKKDG